jgi:tRNA threonylcarbamoyladenosine biosynthesis protein TsaE
MWKYLSCSAAQTSILAEKLAGLTEPGDIFCINGQLGTGKTVFAKGLAEGLGVTDRVTSPTFTLINEYQGRCPFYHMDVYRLNSSEDMEDLGYQEYFYGDGVTLVEWAEIVKEVLPEERLEIFIERIAEDSRKIIFHPYGERYKLLVEELKNLVSAGD